jgi:hypothetical protein
LIGHLSVEQPFETSRVVVRAGHSAWQQYEGRTDDLRFEGVGPAFAPSHACDDPDPIQIVGHCGKMSVEPTVKSITSKQWRNARDFTPPPNMGCGCAFDRDAL